MNCGKIHVKHIQDPNKFVTFPGIAVGGVRLTQSQTF